MSGESRLVTADGTPRWMSWTNQLHLDIDGEPMLRSVLTLTSNAHREARSASLAPLLTSHV